MAKILYGNISLIARTGTEVVTIETVRGLQRRGHEVAVFVGRIGPTAQQLHDAGIPVLTSLNNLPWTPDIVHSNHLIQSLTAAGAVPDVPQVFCCHDSDNWHSAPPQLSLVRRLVAVDDLCEARLRTTAIRPLPPIVRLTNAVDLERFPQREALPQRPQRALALTKHSAHLDELHKVCVANSIQLDVLGPGAGQVVDDLPSRLPHYDIVFATARMALEALAVGCAVVVADGRGLAGMVNSLNASVWRRDNYGKRLLTTHITAKAIQQAIDRFDHEDARRVSNWIRENASLNDSLRELEQIYSDAMADFQAKPIPIRQTLAELPNAFQAVMAHTGIAHTAAIEEIFCRLEATKVLENRINQLERERSQETSRSALFRRWLRLVFQGKKV